MKKSHISITEFQKEERKTNIRSMRRNTGWEFLKTDKKHQAIGGIQEALGITRGYIQYNT